MYFFLFVWLAKFNLLKEEPQILQLSARLMSFSRQVSSNSSSTSWTVACQKPVASFLFPSILLAKTLEWVAISFSRGPSQPRDWTHISWTGRWILYHWTTVENPMLNCRCRLLLCWWEIYSIIYGFLAP